MSGNSRGDEVNAASEFLQPTRLQLAVCWIKSAVGASVMLGIIALSALLYLVLMALVSHHLPRWFP
jgi:hypothetical protein